MDDTKKLLIIDLSALFWRAWHASAAKPVNEALQVVLAIIRRAASQYAHVAVACDAPPYKRKELMPSYKANRPETDEGARAVLRDLMAQLDADGFPLWSAKGYEADDVIASAVALARGSTPPLDVTVLTADKDLCQVVGDGVWLCSPKDGSFAGAEEVRAKWGVEPSQMRDLLALMGDTSDNVPGVKGIGAKTAAELLAKHGDIAGIRKAVLADEIKGAKGEALKVAFDDDSLALSWRLVGLDSTLPLDLAAALAPRVQKSGAVTRWKEEPAPLPVPVPQSPPISRDAAHAPEVEGEPVPRVNALALARAEPSYALALEATNLSDAWETAGNLANARFFKCSTQSQVFAVMLLARRFGLDPVTMLMGCDVIEGKLCLTAQMMIGLVLDSGKARYFSLTESTEKIATYTTWRKGDPKPITLSYTMEDAQRAELAGKSNWRKMPKTMLRWRASTALARDVYPDVVRGLATKEEMRSGDGEIDDEIDPSEVAAARGAA